MIRESGVVAIETGVYAPELPESRKTPFDATVLRVECGREMMALTI